MASFNQPYPVSSGNYPMQQQQQQPQQHMQQQQQQGSQQMVMQQGQPNVQSSQPMGNMSQLQQQQPGTQPQQPVMSPTKEPNCALMCRAGQEYVHEIVAKTTDVFQTLKATQLPHGLNPQGALCTFKDRKAKTEDTLQVISANFRSLRIFYDKISEYTADMSDTPVETLIPFEGTEVDDRAKSTSTYKFVTEEYKQVHEEVRLKNQQLNDIITQMRNLIWEINTMISMRKS